MPQPLHQLPESLLRIARTTRLANGRVPALLVHPHLDPARRAVLRPAPLLVWIHGRTVSKELDPGRYLRLARAGIASCALDLPGHGDRFDPALQTSERALEVVEQMAEELDLVRADLDRSGEYQGCKRALGGMSAGGMAALVALCRPHHFHAAVVECTTGNWHAQVGRPMYDAQRVARLNPIDHLSDWRPIPMLALHNQGDEWISVDGQRAFIEAVQERSTQPFEVEFQAYGPTGAPFEHAGFGRMATDAKDRVTAFLVKHLQPMQ